MEEEEEAVSRMDAKEEEVREKTKGDKLLAKAGGAAAVEATVSVSTAVPRELLSKDSTSGVEAGNAETEARLA